MLHTKIKIFDMDSDETNAEFEKRVNDFMQNKNVKNVIPINDGLVIHYSDNTY